MFTKKAGSNDFAFSNAHRDYYGTISCDVTLESTGEVIPFTASPDDPEDYGRELYEQLNTKDLASVAPFTDAEREAQDTSTVREMRDYLLYKTDWTQSLDVPEATRSKWVPYRQDLRDITDQVGYPSSVIWPIAPN